jgi:hypothetical protein
MITTLSVAVKIWAKTITIVIVIFAICAMVANDSWGYLFLGMALIFGYFVSSPLLIVISPLVKWSSRLPYANRSKMAWLVFCLFLVYWLIFIGLRLMAGDHYHGIVSKEEALFALSIIVVQFIVVRTTRKSLYKLYEQP